MATIAHIRPSVRLSVTTKLDGIPSWSLPAGKTCPGAATATVCNGCYAKTGNYRFPSVKAPREHNREDWKRDAWVDDMVAMLDNHRYFRWFDSGDMYKPALAWKIAAVIKLTPWVKHWLPTQSWSIAAFSDALEFIQTLPNVVVRYSAKHVDQPIQAKHSSVVISESFTGDGVKVCEAYQHDGKCNGCRACWDSNVSVIAYPAHGVSMAKHIAMKVAA